MDPFEYPQWKYLKQTTYCNMCGEYFKKEKNFTNTCQQIKFLVDQPPSWWSAAALGIFLSFKFKGRAIWPSPGSFMVNWVSDKSFSSRSSKHHKSHAIRAAELKFWENVHPTPCITFHVSSVTCHMLHLFFFLFLFSKKEHWKKFVTCTELFKNNFVLLSLIFTISLSITKLRWEHI